MKRLPYEQQKLLNTVLQAFVTYKGKSFGEILLEEWKQETVPTVMVHFVREMLRGQFSSKVRIQEVHKGSEPDFCLLFEDSGAEEIRSFLSQGGFR